LLSAETGRLTDPGPFTETSDPPPACLADAEVLPLALSLSELLLPADTGAFTAPGSVADTSDPPPEWLPVHAGFSE
jgi:hypothetical protein